MEHAVPAAYQGSRYQPQPGDVVVYASKKHCLILAMLGLLMGTMIVVASQLPADPTDPLFDSSPVRALLLLGALLFVRCTVRGVRLAVTSAPGVVMRHDGVWIHPELWPHSPIAWSQIESMTVLGYRYPRHTEMRVALSVAWTTRRSHLTLSDRLHLVWLLHLRWPRTLVLSDTLLNTPMTTLLREARSHFHHQLVRYGIDMRDSSR